MKNSVVQTAYEGSDAVLIYLNGRVGQGKFTIIDPIDYSEEIAQTSWELSTYGYVCAYVQGPRRESRPERCAHCGHRPKARDHKKVIYLHRLILSNNNGLNVDHINRNRLDNRRANLRTATDRQNAFNSKKRNVATATSRYKGVHWDKTKRRWIASFWVGKKCTVIGRFTDEEAAARAYDAAIVDRGEFAVFNFPD